MTASRIRGKAVPPLVPATGPVQVLLVGEAPGPRGADKSGVPFFGDAAGRHLYTALTRLGAMTLPDAVDAMPWDGALFASQALQPIPHGVALGNAYDRCPTDDGDRFRAPTRAELEGPANLRRIRREIEALRARGLAGIVTLGRVAARTMQAVRTQLAMDDLHMAAVPHPSAQGLLSMAPNRGRGARMADLQETWIQQCMAAVQAAGFTGNAT